MASRSSNNFIGSLVVIALVVGGAKAIYDSLPGALLIAIGTIVLVTLAYKYYKQQAYCAEMLKKSKEIVTNYKDELSIRRKQLTIHKNYGIIDDSKWVQEQVDFVQNVIVPRIGMIPSSITADLAAYIELSTKNFSMSKKSFRDSFTPVEYEHFVADTLESLGWRTRVTKASGDQGTDVIAEKGGVKVVLQCKLYTNSVGNSAVQEIAAGKTHEQADFAAVVSNAQYTRSAMQLAGTNGVFMLHHDQLNQLTGLCGLKEEPTQTNEQAFVDVEIGPGVASSPNPPSDQSWKLIAAILTVLVGLPIIYNLFSSDKKQPSVTYPAPQVSTTSATQPPPVVNYSTLTPTTPATTASPSFDCSRAKSTAEHLICADPELAARDREIRTLYVQAKAVAPNLEAFKANTIQAWKYREKTCADKSCIFDWYASRQKYYESFLNN